MPTQEIEAARKCLDEETENLEEYFEGFEEIRYIYDFLQLHRSAKKSILTWTEGRWFFSYTERKKRFREAYRDFSHFVMFSHAVIEYLTSKVIEKEISPNGDEELLEEIVGDLTQFRRERKLKNQDYIESGEVEDYLNRIRGLRNDFAHNMRAQFNIEKRGHPADQVENIWTVISYLSKLVYDDDLENVTSYLEDCFMEPPKLSTENLPTAKLVDEYQHAKEENQPLEKYESEFQRRGFNPEKAPAYNSFEHVENLDRFWFGYGDGSEGWGIIRISDISMPNSIARDDWLDVSFSIDVVNNPDFFKAPGSWMPELEDLEYYAVLLLDDEVRDVYPSATSGKSLLGSLKKDSKEDVNFSVKLGKAGKYDVECGIYVKSEKDSIEWIQTVAPDDDLNVYGP